MNYAPLYVVLFCIALIYAAILGFLGFKFWLALLLGLFGASLTCGLAILLFAFLVTRGG